VDRTWTPENPDSFFPLYERGATWNLQRQSRYIESGAFIRLKSLNLSYDFPQKLVAKLGIINSIRIYFTGQNLWDAGPKPISDIFDLETLGNVTATDGKIYPTIRSFAFGINITL